MKRNGMITVFSAALVLGGWIWASAGNYKLPDTGQNRCYDNSTEIRCPDPGEAFYGQDAQFAGPQPAYQDNGDGTVTDLNTGLMWEQVDGGSVYCSHALAHCDELSLANHSDWRIPTRSELLSIVDYGYYSSNIASIDETYFPGCGLEKYWSSSIVTNDPGSRWYVDFSSGKTGLINCFDSVYYQARVRCVRSGY